MSPFVIDRKEARALSEKLNIVEAITKTKNQVSLVVVCAGGLKSNGYSDDLVAGSLSLDAFF